MRVLCYGLLAILAIRLHLFYSSLGCVYEMNVWECMYLISISPNGGLSVGSNTTPSGEDPNQGTSGCITKPHGQ